MTSEPGKSGPVNLAIGQPSPDLIPRKLLRSSSREFYLNAAPDDLNYGESQGSEPFREALADFLSAGYKGEVSADELFVTAGASQALDFICSRFTRPGDVVLVEDPSYFLAFQIFKDHGLKIVGMPMDDQGVITEHLEKVIEKHQPRLLYVIPSYQNPSGTSLSSCRRKELVRLAQQHDFLLVADEVYQLLNYRGEPPPAMGLDCQSGHVLSMGSFSKILAPGMRLGWIQTGPELMQKLIHSGVITSGGNFSHFSSLVVQASLGSGQLAEHIQSLRMKYMSRMDAMSEALDEYMRGLATWVTPSGGYFYWLKLNRDVDLMALRPVAMKQGTGFLPGSLCSDNPQMRQHLRLSFARYPEARIRQGVALLANLIRESS